MPKKIFFYYLYCQTGGWGLLLLNFCTINSQSLIKSLIAVGIGLIASHGLREMIIRRGWLRMPVPTGLIRIGFALVAVCVVAGSVRWAEVRLVYGEHFSRWLPSVATSVLGYLFIMVPWTCIYCLVDYMREERRNGIRTGVLKMRLDEMRRKGYI